MDPFAHPPTSAAEALTIVVFEFGTASVGDRAAGYWITVVTAPQYSLPRCFDRN